MNASDFLYGLNVDKQKSSCPISSLVRLISNLQLDPIVPTAADKKHWNQQTVVRRR
jgi:hypothetical protein